MPGRSGLDHDRRRCGQPEGDDVRAESMAQMMLSRWKTVWGTIKGSVRARRSGITATGNIRILFPICWMRGGHFKSVQPECMDIDEIHRRFGKRATLDGCVGTQSTMPWGTSEDVRRCVKELIKNYGKNGGLILSLPMSGTRGSHRQYRRFFQACLEFGTFE